MEAPLMTPTRSSSESIEATTLRSTPITSTTAALSTGWIRRAGGGVRSMVASSTRVRSMVFPGLSPPCTSPASLFPPNPLPALAVGAARSEARAVEDAEQGLVGQRLVGEVAARERGRHHVVELHWSRPPLMVWL